MDKLASEYKVLIVDDVPTNVMLVQAILKKEGYTLLTCDSGTKALRIANEKHPNLILLDIMMPEMDGYEVLQHLKSNPETTDIPVIIMSALSDMQSIVKGYQLGATEYVTKPFQREELVKRWPTATSFTASNASRPSWRTRSSLGIRYTPLSPMTCVPR